MPARAATMRARRGEPVGLVLSVAIGLCVFGRPAYGQSTGVEKASCLLDFDLPIASQTYLLGDWCGERTRLEQRGVTFDFKYDGDILWGFQNPQDHFGPWNRFRATVDIDFS